ncbi:alpha/beta hydrolase-fold protein [Paenibacillus sp. GYB004]|uniref:alpha/beta hydrolase n=1 Tax=Paenibacillus sp. GYB004 TaxID=2994393 RepID=UPI002F961DE6
MTSLQQQPVHIPRSQQMTAEYRGRTYRIFISMPSQSPPASGYPVIYVLDANSVFATMTETIRAQSRTPEKTGVFPAIVVGIGYETEEPFHPNRHYDFTMPVPRSELPKHPTGGEWPKQGGASGFMTFIEDELKPAIAAMHPVDPARQSIFGHSLGGLFVLHAFLTHPGAFQTYIAGSPSIHWNESALLEKERTLPARLSGDGGRIGLLIAMGEQERTHKSNAYDKAEAMAARLSAPNHSRLDVSFKSFAEEGHISVLPVLISHAVRFLSKNPR